MKKILGFICVMLAAVALTACGGGSSDDAPVVGTWSSPVASEILNFDISLTFNANGSGSENWDDDVWDFEWEVSGDRLTVTFADEDDAREATFEIDGDTLTITGGGALAGEWVRD